MQVSKFSLMQLLWPENRYVSDDIEDEQINVFGVQVIVYSSNYLIIPFSVSRACRCTTCLIRVCRLIMGPRRAVDSRRLIHRLIDYVTLAVHTGALFRVRLCGVYTQSGKRRGEYALAVLLPPLSRPSSSPSPPSALASGTGRVWSSQLIRRGAGRAAGHVVCPGTTKSIVRRMAATARLDPLTWLRLRSRLPKEFRTVRIDFR